MSGISFRVAEVESSTVTLPAVVPESALRGRFGRQVEAFSLSGGLVDCGNTNMLVRAAEVAFYEHYPLVLSPDIIWLCLARGFALHVNAHAEELRGRFVRHQGKERLRVDRPDFLPGRDNPWPEAFAQMSDQIAARVGKLRELVVPDFSTTGPLERTCAQVMLMDTFQAYFEYSFFCGCGIPSITLLGTPADWRSLRARAALFAEYGLDGWVRVLDPVLGKVIDTSEGRVDVDFWRSFFRHKSMSGGNTVTGWLLTLFPYLGREGDPAELEPNPFLHDWADRHRAFEQDPDPYAVSPRLGPGVGRIPAALGFVPLQVQWGQAEAPMCLVGGLLGVQQDAAKAVSPACGWALLQDGPGARLSDDERWG